MRRLVLPVAAWLVLALSCAPRLVPAPIVTTPRYPEFVRPPVPVMLADSRAALFHDRAWRFLQAGDLKSADREVAAALAAAPGFYPAEAASGYVALARGDARAALARFDAAVRTEGTYVSAIVGRGQALVALDRDADAIAAFEAALALDASLADLRRRVEVLQFRALERHLTTARAAARAGRSEEAVAAYREALARSPESAFLHRELAQVQRQHGGVAAALEQFRRAIDLDPDDAASHLEVAAILEEQGDLESAIRSYEAVLSLEANGEAAARRDRLRARLELARLPPEYRAIATSLEVTRADLAALIGVTLEAVLQTAGAREAVVLTDVRANWAEAWILEVARAGILEPFPNHTFQPAAIVRRQDLAQAVGRLLPRLATAPELRAWQGSRVRFPDLSASHLAFPAAQAAVAAGVMTTAPGGDFEPSRPVTGAEAVAAVERLQVMARRSARRDARP